MVPQWLPRVASGERLGLRVNSGWHQVQRLIPAREATDPVPYELVPYDVLENLPNEDGRSKKHLRYKGGCKRFRKGGAVYPLLHGNSIYR